MSVHTPDPKRLIGKQEDASLEFKAPEALQKPVNIAREVVAFLNAGGGNLWIGVREQDGIATSLQPIPSVVAARDALWNHLVDTIEPSPMSNEVAIESIPTGNDDGDIILIKVRQGRRHPYALIKDRGRHFLIRAGARIREMSRDEIFNGKASLGDDEDASRRKVAKEVMDEIGRQRASGSYWWTIVPVRPLGIDFENMPEENKRFCRELLTDPSRSGNRRNGWTVVLDHGIPRFTTEKVTHVFGDPPTRHEVTFEASGRMTFVAPRVRLETHWRPEGGDISAFALIELPVSSFRIAAKFFERFAPGKSKVVVAAVIGGLKGARLQPGSPAEPSRPWKKAEPFGDDDLVVSPFEIEGNQVQTPDAAAYRLVVRIYEQFGLGAEDIPTEFSPVDRILRFGR